MKITKTQLREIIREEMKLNEENESTWTWIYKGLLDGFRKADKKGGVQLDDVAQAVGFLLKTEWGGGVKNDFMKAAKKHIK